MPGEIAALTPNQARRYARHLFLEEIGPAGQRRLLASIVRVPGEGPAAEEAAVYLAAAGVGRLVLDRSLARTLAPRLAGLNPDVRIATRADGGPPVDLELVALAPDARRLAGALAALAGLIALVRPDQALPTFSYPGIDLRWRRPPTHG